MSFGLCFVSLRHLKMRSNTSSWGRIQNVLRKCSVHKQVPYGTKLPLNVFVFDMISHIWLHFITDLTQFIVWWLRKKIFNFFELTKLVESYSSFKDTLIIIPIRPRVTALWRAIQCSSRRRKSELRAEKDVFFFFFFSNLLCCTCQVGKFTDSDTKTNMQ